MAAVPQSAFALINDAQRQEERAFSNGVLLVTVYESTTESQGRTLVFETGWGADMPATGVAPATIGLLMRGDY